MKIQHIKSTNFGGYSGSPKELYTTNHNIKLGGGGEITGGFTAYIPTELSVGCNLKGNVIITVTCHLSSPPMSLREGMWQSIQLSSRNSTQINKWQQVGAKQVIQICRPHR